ncbi:arginase family protein [Rhodococcus sp. H29-C3]|uniref:arginase family protein n=1 Tax=Rhodococcus sp. H29-C3 TaxID=3046307 RepID=UPI0024B9B526|nr:arginase family protein [Rhodococcus sp. H29-C3]MDJ0362259.1 arginase family protein [Rhodococcus sp. H29-C3]
MTTTNSGRSPLSLSLIGVPNSAGSYAPGQERTPRVLREAGLIEALIGTGAQVIDAGDLPKHIWAPDRQSPRAQNAAAVVESLIELAERVRTELAHGRRVLVIGGNCTIATGALAGLQHHATQPCGLLYIDRHFDMNTPDTTREGALDWMGLGHAFGLPGSLPEWTSAFGDGPLTRAGQVAFLGVDPSQGNDFERENVFRLALDVTTQQELIDDPRRAAQAALDALPKAPFAVHIDVDVLDFTDAPLAENTSGRNRGPTLCQLTSALETILADQRWRVLTIGEINPTRADGAPETLIAFNESLATAVLAAITPPAI